jgi:NAD(P)H-hydrate epimerase
MMARYDAILIGPGLGSAAGVMEPLLAERDALPPLVVDADGLNYLAQQENWWRLLPANTILTPHPGEMARLVGRGSDAGERLALARRKSAEWGHIVVLKGAYTIVAEPSGSATLVPSASAALAVAGSGDVLAGVIVSLLAQGVVPYAAACLGAYLHATAGEMAAAPLGGAGMLAHEIADSLPAARQRVAAIAR